MRVIRWLSLPVTLPVTLFAGIALFLGKAVPAFFTTLRHAIDLWVEWAQGRLDSENALEP